MNDPSDMARSDAQMVGHAALISSDPLIVSTPTNWQNPIGLAEALGRYCADQEVTFLLPLYWHCNKASAAAKAVAIKAHRSQYPAHELIILGNTPDEVELLKAVGAQAFFANHNIFASEEVFHPLPDVNLEFDAVYNARPISMKRHELASLVERVVYISFVSPGQEALYSPAIVSDLLKRGAGHVFANPIVDGFPRMIEAAAVNSWLARASVGLCLSEQEGAMYASIEYLLAGLPIVSTPSRGGRDVFFDPDYCIIADPDPRAIREAVEALRDRNIPRSHVRARTLEKLTRERQRFLAFIDEIRARHGVPNGHRTEWAFSGAPFHKWRSVEHHASEILGATIGESSNSTSVSRQRRRREKPPTIHRLVSFVGQNDSDILPFFLDHYRRLGIGAFHLMLHGTWSKAELTPLFTASDVTVEGFNGEPFDDVLLTSSLDAMARQFEGEWVIIVDADEFLELPYASLSRTIDALKCLGMDELPASLLQRTAPDGVLRSLAEGAPETLFPCYDYRLAERMDTEFPVWKSKYPLVRIGPEFRFAQGNHHPSNCRAAMHLPIRGVLHHFKWRDRLLRSLARARGEVGKQQGNPEEQNAYHRWLEGHGQRVPTDGLKVYNRSELIRDGILIRPARDEVRVWAALRKARQGRSAALASIPHALPQPDSGMGALDRIGLRTLPGRIALVTTDLLGLRRTGGIGTAMTALAERLAGEGHEVHVFLCPWGDHNWHQIWADHWEARGCQVHHHPLQRGWTLADASMFIADAINATNWDVIHFAENDGLGAPVQLLRSAGLAFQNTQVVVTAHGPTRWHRHGNLVHWTESEALGSGLEATSIELADVLVCPSSYIAEWCKARYTRPTPPIVVPNSLTGEGRRFGRGPREKRPIRKIVFFGRLEVRKGIDRFIAAINRVIERGLSDFEVVFLGSFVSYHPLSELERRTETWPCQKRILENYTSHDAIDLLRTEDCIAVMPSRLDNSPYCVFECLDNAVPFIATDVGGTAELIHEDDRARVLVSGDPEEIAEKLVDALQNGAAPAAMSFDPTLADIDLLALHGNLVDKARASRGQPARRSQSKASVIVYGPKADLAAPPLAEWLGRVGGASVEVMWCIGRGPDTEADWYGNATALNAAAKSASHEHLFLCHTAALPDPDALTALLTAMDETGADAAVCGYRFQSAHGTSESVAVFAAPAELSTQQNIYGARLFLVRKTVFLEAGGFSDEPSAIGIMEWEFLNRLKAAGRRIIGIPIALATATGAVAPETLTESQAGALTAPWTEVAPLHLQGFIRMALHPDRPAIPIPHPVSFRGEWTVRDPKPSDVATAAPAAEDWQADAGRIAETIEESEIVSAASLLDGIDVANDSLNREGRLRIGSDGRLLDTSETYRIQTAADADACNFLVAENLLDAEQASLLAEAFRDVEGQILRANGGALPAKTFLWMREISAKRPDAVDPLVALIKNGMTRTAEFYGVEPPLFPDLIQLRKLGTGRSALPIRRAAPSGAYPVTDALNFTGNLFLSDDCEGGALYFTGLDMAVEPKLGRFVAATSGAYHEQALLRVDSGALLVLSFVMRRRRDQISPDLRKIF